MKQKGKRIEIPDDVKFIDGLIQKLAKARDSELDELVADEMVKAQPALQNLVNFFYTGGKFSMPQMLEVSRLIILMYWYYKDKLKDPNIKIGEPLYLEMRAKHENFFAQMEGKSPDYNWILMEDDLEEEPGRFLYGYYQQVIFHQKLRKLASLPAQDKAFLLSNLRIMMDCFESLSYRSTPV